MKKLFFTFSVFIAFYAISFSQSLDWGFKIGGTHFDKVNNLVIGTDGSIYIAGTFNNTVDFDPGINTFNMTSTAGSGYADIFIAKYTNNGAFVWAFQIGNTIVDYFTSWQLNLEINSQNNLFLYTSSCVTIQSDFNPNPNITTNPNGSTCLASYNSNGELLWLKSFGSYHWAHSLCIDNQNNIIITGSTPHAGLSFTPSITFESGNSNSTLTGYCSFITKFSSSGNFIFTKKLSAGIYFNKAITDDLNNIILTGYNSSQFSNSGTSVDFDPSSNNTNITNHLDKSLFLVKYNTDGNLLWVNAFQNIISTNVEEYGNDILTDASNNIYLIATFKGQVDLDFSTNTILLTSPLTSGGYFPSDFVVKYSSTGSYANHIQDNMKSGFVDNNNNLYTVAYTELKKYNSSFNLQASKSLNGSTLENVKLINSNNLVLYGYFTNKVDINPDSDTLWLYSSGINQYPQNSYDFFIVKFFQTPSVIKKSLNQNICKNDSVKLFIESGGTAPFNYQWKRNGNNINGANSDVYIIPNANTSHEGTYTCEITNDYGQVISGPIEVKIVSLSLNAGSDKIACKGSAIQLQALGNSNYSSISGSLSYMWSPTIGINNQNISNPVAVLDSSIKYVVTLSDQIGCSIKDTININIQKPYNNQKICLVTVDPISGKNKIVWEKTPNVGTEYYIIYKENGTNNYIQSGNILSTQTAEFIDYFSQPESHGDKYKIAVLDTCGNESALSPYHKTMNLTISSFGTTMGLNWDKYIDESGSFTPFRYYIYRGISTNNMILYDSVSGSFNSYNDVNVTSLLYYKIGVIKPGGCNTSKSESMAFSNNIDNSNLIGIDEYKSDYSQSKIFPHPVSNEAYIYLNENILIKNNFVFNVFNISGQKINSNKYIVSYDNINNSTRIKFAKGELNSGIYYIEINSDKTYRFKIVFK